MRREPETVDWDLLDALYRIANSGDKKSSTRVDGDTAGFVREENFVIEDNRRVNEVNSPIVVQRVANGFIVRPPGEWRANYTVVPDVVHVFSTFAMLEHHLREHFPD